MVVAHPGEGSLTRALASAVVEGAAGVGAEVRVHDLYADGFDPRMPQSEVGTTVFGDALTARYASEVLAADAFAIVHPVWFFHAPAIVKGWVDRVMREGVAYDLAAGVATSRLRARALHVFNTANAAAGAEGVFGNQLERFWFDVVFGSVKLEHKGRTLLPNVAGSSLAEREEWLAAAHRQAAEMLLAPK